MPRVWAKKAACESISPTSGKCKRDIALSVGRKVRFVKMKSTGIVRSVDNLGRIVLPMEMRRTMKIEPNGQLEIFVDQDSIIMRNYRPGCIFCGKATELIYKGQHVCKECAIEAGQAPA